MLFFFPWKNVKAVINILMTLKKYAVAIIFNLGVILHVSSVEFNRHFQRYVGCSFIAVP